LINSKEAYDFFLEADRIALQKPMKTHNRLKRWLIYFFFEDIWKFERLLRKVEYYKNCRQDPIGKAYYYYLRVKLHKAQVKLQFSIQPNTVGPGLSISRIGYIIVHPNSTIGENCRIHPGVIIGAKGGKDLVPKIGNNVFIGPGAKIFGDIEIADGIAIGANSYVNKSFLEKNITIAGIPARKIQPVGSERLYFRATDVLKANKEIFYRR
jgi:serine O-acetyltransferase